GATNTLLLTVANNGTAAANNVSVSALVSNVAGAAAAAGISPALVPSLAGGASTTFTITSAIGTAQASVSFSAQVAGTDAVSAATTISAAALSSPAYSVFAQ